MSAGTEDRVDVETLEQQRDFLLRSLDDLESEREAGNIDDNTYRLLHDDYTARASAVLQSIDSGKDVTKHDESRPSLVMRVVTVGGIVAFAVVAAVLLSNAIGQRRSGQTITGNAQAAGSPTTIGQGSALAAEVKRQPQSYAARITYARYLLGAGDVQNAIEQYDAAATIDPSQAEALAYGGWIRGLVAQQVTNTKDRSVIVDGALQRLDRAIAADANYADAYVFKGLVLLNLKNDPAGAVPAFQQFLVLAPSNHPMRQEVLDVLARAEKSATTTSTPRP
jgi:tetratricopeptide (TPR) repeat protein